MHYEAEPSLYFRIRRAISSFGITEKLIFSLFSTLFVVSALFIIEKINLSVMTQVPVQGGTLNEGIVGYPSTLNPVLTFSDADKDLTSLIYSGLLKATPSGEFIPDLAQSFTVSSDGLTYDVIIKSSATFQDGAPVTADDILFTIQKIQDPDIKSPKAANWSGITVQKINEKEVTFTLKKPYAPFLENLTVGILPKHIWQDIASPLFSLSTYNQEPIGSGPYMIKAAKSQHGFYEYYDLVPFEKYALGAPNIEHITLRFYKNEEDAVKAYNSGTINSIGGLSIDVANMLATKGAFIKKIPLPRIFAIFFNQSQAPVLLNNEVRQALNIAIDRGALIDTTLKGYGRRATGPIPAGLISDADITNAETASTSTTSTIDQAKAILTAKGWKMNAQGIMEKQVTSNGKTSTQVLRFSISTSNVPELSATASYIKDQWKLIGADVTLGIYEPTDLNQKVIRPRKYDALLFGNVVGKDLDVYPFWHSSQRNDPGLNIAMYANLKTDKLLETARATASSTVRDESLKAFEKEVLNDIPAVFLYSPEYIYILPKNIQNADINNITTPTDRFMSISDWYIETEGVWNIFLHKQ